MSRIRTILHPTDFSDLSAAALGGYHNGYHWLIATPQ